MKKFVLLISIFCIVFIKCKTFHSIKQDAIYKVYKIDSVKSYYLIYAEKDSLRYKIVSQKQKVNDCNKIIVGGTYSFKLHSMTKINGKNITPLASTYEISGTYVDDNTIISFEREIQWDLFYGDNIKGLSVCPK